jgi:hypothetical protein
MLKPLAITVIGELCVSVAVTDCHTYGLFLLVRSVSGYAKLTQLTNYAVILKYITMRASSNQYQC